MPAEGLKEATQALVQALEGSGEQREEYWTRRIEPFWQSIWPKSLQVRTKGVAEGLARLSIAARGEFSRALNVVHAWLQPLGNADFVVHLLHESNVASRVPEDALRLLDAVVGDQPWVPSELAPSLRDISRAAPALSQDSRYRRLEEYSRRRAG
jgi:hypothetical protein